MRTIGNLQDGCLNARKAASQEPCDGVFRSQTAVDRIEFDHPPVPFIVRQFAINFHSLSNHRVSTKPGQLQPEYTRVLGESLSISKKNLPNRLGLGCRLPDHNCLVKANHFLESPSLSANLYPMPRTVIIYAGFDGSVSTALLRRLMCTSTVRGSTNASSPQTLSSSCSRL